MKYKAQKKEPPPRSWWQFNGVPEGEQWACYYYEFYREHTALREEIVMAWTLPQYEQRDKLAMLTNFVRAEVWCGEPADNAFRLIPHHSEEAFPETPWQEISDDQRASILKSLPKIERLLCQPVQQDGLPQYATQLNERARKGGFAPKEFVIIPLDWSLDDLTLKRRFNAILSHRPPGTKGKRIKRRRSPLDGLRALGVRRLKKHYGGITPLLEAITKNLVDLSYSEDAALRQAVRRAEMILEEFGPRWK